MFTNIDTLIKSIDQKLLNAFSVGALLYTPATNAGIFEKLKSGEWTPPYSLAFCLEDSIADSAVPMGEQNILDTFQKIQDQKDSLPYLPKLFIRVREAGQITRLFNGLGRAASNLGGFIIPKFSPQVSGSYLSKLNEINQVSKYPISFMPILESSDLISPQTRTDSLTKLYEELLLFRDYILNVRVGGNDLCHSFGLRRRSDETIYDIRPVSNILSDIVTVFHSDFILSGPVWEYFADEDGNWKKGLEKEIRLDMLNGFIGKTVIHPNQIEVVNHSLAADPHDLEDAISILTFENAGAQVAKSAKGTRMNEIKTHANWAQKQVILAYLYGVRQ